MGRSETGSAATPLDESLPAERVAELRMMATKDRSKASWMGIFLPPLSYVYLEERTWAALNVLTLNYLLLGTLLVPVHVNRKIKDARRELAIHGYDY